MNRFNLYRFGWLTFDWRRMIIFRSGKNFGVFINWYRLLSVYFPLIK